jgi:DNA helicase-2/ATP-dependent DNA helicase PcrA
VETFRNRIRARLEDLGLPLIGFDVRTLHSLALEIVKMSTGEFGGEMEELIVADETQSNAYISAAVDGWIMANRDFWLQFVTDDNPTTLVRWRDVTENAAKSLISIAKNQRYEPDTILNRLDNIHTTPTLDHIASRALDLSQESVFGQPFLWMMTGIYRRYQVALSRAGALDFNDIIWQASNILESDPGTAQLYRQRWPIVLEDEAQDSVPLQELLLSSLTGPEGNWARAGDPNQAITSSFTAAHPSYFSEFLSRPDVVNRPLPHSGRSARKIYQAANTILHWTNSSHPVEEVRNSAFYLQDILPVPPGDTQPNPPDDEAKIEIRVFNHREEEELPAIARQAHNYINKNPLHTVAILVPTNRIGHMVAAHLDSLDAAYDDLLRGGKRLREIATTIQAILAVLASPLTNRNIVRAHDALLEFDHPSVAEEVDSQRVNTLLRSIHSPEKFLFPKDDGDFEQSLPSDIATANELRYLRQFADLLNSCLELRILPADDLVLALSDLLLSRNNGEDTAGNEADLAAAYQIAQMIGRWRDMHPDWRLPELTAQLHEVASGRLPLRLPGPAAFGYQPSPGRITLATQHGAKGMEWDGVFLVGIDGRWIPGNLEAPFMGDEGILNADPVAEMTAQFQLLMSGSNRVFANRSATDSAHIELICERFRLLYVGITRAKIYLHISRSRKTKPFQTDYDVLPATVMRTMYHFISEY